MKFVLVLIVLSLIGCAGTSGYKASSKLSSIDGNGKYSEIERDMTRTSSSGMVVQRVGYYAEVTPETPALARSFILEQCKKNLESSEICNSKVTEKLKLLEKASCAQIVLSTMSIEAAKKEMWKVKVEQPVGSYIEGVLVNFRAVPEINVGNQVRPWINSGQVCFNPRIDYLKTFKMLIIPQFGGADYVPLELIWEEPKKDKAG